MFVRSSSRLFVFLFCFVFFATFRFVLFVWIVLDCFVSLFGLVCLFVGLFVCFCLFVFYYALLFGVLFLCMNMWLQGNGSN